MGYADDLGNREYPVTNYGEIEWDTKKTAEYFKDCQVIYEDFLRMSDGFIGKFENFENDVNHTGPEAESSKAFVKECEVPLLVDMTDNVQQLEDLQVKLMEAFAGSVDKSDSAIVKTTHLKKIIADYIGYEASLKDTGDSIKKLAQELNAECSAVGKFTEPEYKESLDAMKLMTTEDGTEGHVPVLLDAFLSFDEAHKNDIKNSDFRSLYNIIADNIKKFMAGIGDGRFYDITTFNDTRNKLDWKDPKDELKGASLEDYLRYVQTMDDYLKGKKERCEVYKYDPVNMCNGNYINEQDDLTIGGRYEIVFHRFYNAISDDEGVLGRGWTHSYETRLAEIEDGIRIYYPDGSKGIYRKDKEKDFYIEEHGEPGVLTKEKGGYLIKSDNGDYRRFDEAGYLLSEGRHEEEYRVFKYDKYTGIRKLIYIKTPNGSSLKLDYDENGYLNSLTDHTGRYVSYAYSAHGYLNEITFADGSKRRFSYYENGLIKNVYNSEGVISITNEYDEKRRTIKQSFPDGGVMTYEYDDEKRTTTATEQNGNKVIYTHDDLGRHIKTEYYDGTESFRYNDRNQKIAYTDKNGNTTRYAYDNKGHLTKYIDPKGNVTSITYFANGMPSAVKGAKGEEYRFTYDSEGHLFEVKNPLGENDRFYYDDGKLVKEKDALLNTTEYEYDEKGNISAITDADGVRFEYEYDDLGRVVLKEESKGGRCSFTYNKADKVTSVTDANGSTRKYTYNKSGKVTRIEDPDGTCASWEYNDMGKEAAFTDPAGRKTVYIYNTMWKRDSIVLPNGGIIRYEYDALMRVKSITDPMGRRIDYVYDPNGNVTGVSMEGTVLHTFEYDECDRIIKEADAMGHSASYEYNQYGKVIAATDNSGNITRQDFDILGRIIRTIDPLGRESVYSYTKTGKLESVTDSKGRKTEFQYTKAGRMKSILFCGEKRQELFYDKKGRIDRRIFHDGYKICYTYDSLGRVNCASGSDGKRTEYTYDSMGRVLSVSDNGSITEYTYTPAGMIKSIRDAEGSTVSYEYDSIDNLVRINRGEKDFSDTDERFPVVSNDGHVTVYEYDLSGQMIRQIDALGQEEKYSYDSYGRLSKKTDRDGYDTEYGYEMDGSLKKVLYADGKSVEFTYDALGLISRIVDWTGTTNVERDSLGRIEKITDPKNRTVGYTYGSSGERTSITYPDGKRVDYLYDNMTRLSAIVDGANKTLYDYDENGRLSRKVLPNSVELQLSYLPGGYLKEMIARDDEGIIDSYVYSYDDSGRRSDVERHRRNLEHVSGLYHYDYDKIGRLTGVQRNNELIRSYSYDSFGNRRSFEEEGNTTSYTYDALDRLISSETTLAGNDVHEITAYNYDRRGNMTEMFVDGAISKRFKFDSTNKMIWGYDRDEGEADYKYNGIGKRVAVKTPEEDIEYILDITKFYNDMLGREVNGQKESYVYDSGIISMDRDGEDYFYLLDELGSTMRLTGTDGDTVSAYAYDEFGRTFDPFTGKNKKAKEHPYNKEGNILQPLAFTGYQTDDITGNYYAQARYYNAGCGRFISRDMDAFMFIEDPESLNLYEYCQNSPIEFFDPTGYDPVNGAIGTDAHTTLQEYAELLNTTGVIPGVVRTNYKIPGGAFHTNGEYGFADIVIFHDGIAEVYEIKPESFLRTKEIETDPRYYKNGELPAEGANETRHQLGLDQMQGYVDAYNNNRIKEYGATQAVPGGYKPYFNVTLPASDGGEYRYFTRADSPGMIYYEYKGPDDESKRKRRGIPARKGNDKDDSQGKGGNNSNITEFKPEQKKSPDIAAIVGVLKALGLAILVVVAAAVLVYVLGAALAGAVMTALAAMCLFVVGWFKGLFDPNACDGPA